MSTKYTNIKGGEEIQEFLNQLAPKIEANIMRSALRSGAKIIADQAKDNVPKAQPNSENARLYGGYFGALRDSIRISTKKRRGKVIASVIAGNTTAYYWRFVEFGTAAHLIKTKNKKDLSFNGQVVKTVNHPGAHAKPFMRPALDARGNDAIQAVGDQVKKRLTKEGLNAPDASVDDGGLSTQLRGLTTEFSK